jgi:lipopolysaccharide/colanic/teichoic acid biosynthesis glycosyltransferase
MAYIAKRIFDYVAAGAGLVVGSPFLLLIAGLIRLDSPGNPIYRQERVGLGGRHYRVYKFRTMIEGAPIQFNEDGSTRVAAGDPRVTRLGRVLRAGLDELPQLLNILRGEMSLVGPRPDMPVHAQAYTEEERRKLGVLPGVTSLAAVLGRNKIPWKTRMAIDLRYMDRWSLSLDARIVAQTLLLPFRVQLFKFRDVIGSELSD